MADAVRLDPFRRIVNVAWGRGGPWYQWQPRYQPYQWTSQWHDGHLGDPHWAERGFPFEGELFWTNYYPPEFPSHWLRLPRVGVTVVHDGGPLGDGLPPVGFSSLDEQAMAVYYGHADPFSLNKIDFTAPPTVRNPSAGGWIPNVWQIVGRASEQPFHLSNTGVRIYDRPSSALASEIAHLFEQQWNATSDAYNANEIAMDGSVGPVQSVNYFDDDGRPFSVPINAQYQSEPEVWRFGVPVVDGPTTAATTLGVPSYPTNLFDFCGGLPASGWFGGHTIVNGGDYGYRLWIFHPAFAKPTGVGQLNPAKWDTSPVLFPVLRNPSAYPDPA